MLESCADQHEDGPAIVNSSPKPIVIGQAVEFLQALLDMMTEQNIHLEVRFAGTSHDVSQLIAASPFLCMAITQHAHCDLTWQLCHVTQAWGC